MSKTKVTMADARRIQREKGWHFFSRGARKFFNSIIETEGALIGNKYFITSERYDAHYPRFYSVREFDEKTGRVKTISEFQEFKSGKEAKVFASCIANGNDMATCRRRVALS